MRIAIDHLPAVTHPPGVGRYARELVRALVRLDDRPELALLELGLSAPKYTDGELELLGRAERVRHRWPRGVLTLAALFGRDAAALSGGAELVHHVRLPPLPVRRAAQSIALAEPPSAGGPTERAFLALLDRGALVFVFSAVARDELRDRYGLAEQRVAAVPVGAEHWRRAVDGPRPPDRPLRVLVLGRLLDRRAPRATARAHELLRARGLDVELRFVAPRPTHASSRGAEAQAIGTELDFAHDPSVVWGGRDDPRRHEDRLPELVARSAVLLHLDPEARTPVTPLEALALGVPVVASRTPVFEEAFGGELERARGAVGFVEQVGNVVDPEELADLLARALAVRSDPAAVADLERRARPFTWKHCARAHVAAWHAHLARSGGAATASGR